MEKLQHNVDKFDKYCRTCMGVNNSSKMLYIFTKVDATETVADVIASNTSIKVSIQDGLPKKICEACYKQLWDFVQFKKKAESCDAALRNLAQLMQPQDHCKEESRDIKVEVDLFEISSIDDPFEDNIVISNDKSDTEVDNDLIIKCQENAKRYECLKCPKQFSKLSKLQDHLQNHDESGVEETHKHEICAEFIDDDISLKQLKASYSDVKPYICNFCPKTFSRHATLLSHMVSHKREAEMKLDDDQNFVCDICSTVYRSSNSLSAHMKKHRNPNRVLACTICGKVFKKISHLKRHEMIHESNKIYKCLLCTKSFSTEQRLAEHLNAHKGLKPYMCPICSKSFVQNSSLLKHIKIHSRMKGYLCSTCGKKFDSKSNLSQHTKRHLGDKSFACNMCPSIFVSKGEMQCHRNTHLGLKPFKCEECGSSFTKGSSLTKHKLRHLGVKPHQCDACDKKFSSRDHLKRHYRIHTGEKPYKCDICERAFTQSNDLVKHKRAHLGDKLYKCSHCMENFRLKTELRQHITKHYMSTAPSGTVQSNNNFLTNKEAIENVHRNNEASCTETGILKGSVNLTKSLNVK